MGAVFLVIVLGLGIGALGLVAADLYAVGVFVLFLGLIGLTVAAGDWLLRYLGNRLRQGDSVTGNGRRDPGNR